MARFGSEKIRGHGMPEAIEAILVRRQPGRSPASPLLKPISAAISIGTGGPFGAEGPIIMTGGAVGLGPRADPALSADERKTLLVAGAAGGMAATFNAPLASVLLAVELLLFEWRPRSFVPVVAAVATSTLLRGALLGHGAAVRDAARAPASAPRPTELLCIVTGADRRPARDRRHRARLRCPRTRSQRLPIHWMWWPAIGGLIIGARRPDRAARPRRRLRRDRPAARPARRASR